MKYAVLVGVAPMVLGFLAGFFDLPVNIGWSSYIGWFALSLVVGGAVVAIRRSNAKPPH